MLSPSWRSEASNYELLLSRLLDFHVLLISVICSLNPLFPSSYPFSIPEGLRIYDDPGSPGSLTFNDSLSSYLLGFWWDNAFSDVIPFKEVSQ